MRRLLIRLYPAAWRERYAREFDALLDDVNPGWRDLWDIFRGAILMQLSTPAVYLKLGVITAVLGALVAGGVSFTLPERYVSSAVMRITPATAPPDTPGDYRVLAAPRLTVMQQEVLSRNSLAEMIQRPELDLYRPDRMRYPLEDIIQNMRQHDIRVEPFEPPAGASDGGSTAFRVVYESSDPKKAQAVVRALVTKFTQANIKVARDLPPSSRLAATTLEVLDPASLPDKPVQPNRLGIVAIGIAAGFALGLLIAFLRDKPLRWTLWMILSGAVGFGCALGLALSRDFDPVPFACLGAAAGLAIAAFLMRDRAAWKPVPYVKSALATGILTAILAGFGSFAIAERYVSTAVLRIYKQGPFRIAVPDPNGEVPERLRRLQQEIFSRNSLAEIIQRPSLDLYRRERQRYPMEVVIHDMRNRDIRVHPVSGALTAFTISFGYPDRFKAQAVVRELITKFVEGSVVMGRNLGLDESQPGGINIEVIDPASDPTTPVSPNRYQIIAAGLAAGILLGLLIAFFRRRPPGQASAMLRIASAGGAAGAVLAGAISLAIPDHYISTAVLRVKPSHTSGERVQELMMEVLSRQNIGDDLRRHIRIQSLEIDSAGRTTAFSISYEANDAEKAHATVQNLVSKFVEPTTTFTPPGTDPTNLEVLDPASIPSSPSSPARPQMVAAGLFAGVLIGPFFARRRAK